jgi:S-DNA-T family DNA segregation ATPase FtsK/SpoIIIE
LGFSSYDKIPPEARERSPLPRLMIVVDEFAALTREHPDFLELLVAVGRIGRSLGIHLVMATQRASAIPDSLMATLNARFVLRTADRADSVAALGDASAGTLTPRLPGRAFKSTHGSRPVPFQVAYGGDWLEEVVKAANYASLKRPQTWLEAAISWSGLPSKIEADAAGKPGLVALVDDRQRMIIRPWLLGPDSIGSLHIIGTRGSGKSGTLITMVRAFCRSVAADGIDLYVVGFRGGERLRALGGHDRADHVARVVQLAATEARRRKLATSLRESLVISSADEPLTNPGRPLVVAIDDCHLLTHERPELAEPLAELASCDPTTGVALLLSTDFGGASATYCKTLERRLVLRLSDPMDYSKFGIQVDELPTMPPIGRGILQPGQHEVQVVSPGDW